MEGLKMINQTLSRELIYEYENMLLDNKATLSAHFLNVQRK